jgi:hypothetical protein
LAVDVFGSGPNVTFLRFDTLATLDRSVIACGAAPSAWLHAHHAVCFGVFGFWPVLGTRRQQEPVAPD